MTHVVPIRPDVLRDNTEGWGAPGLVVMGGSSCCWGHGKTFTLADAGGSMVTVPVNEHQVKFNHYIYENMQHL